VQPRRAKRRLHANRPHRPVAIEVAILAGFIAAGIVASWPRATYLAGRIPATRDAGSYVWGFWWIAHQVEHLGNPWFTSYEAAPVGVRLGVHTLMPLPGLLLMPVTVIFGPGVSYNLLAAVVPGLLAYVTYRLARLWLSSRLAAIAAGWSPPLTGSMSTGQRGTRDSEPSPRAAVARTTSGGVGWPNRGVAAKREGLGPPGVL
jgi:hypothetical protein